MEVRKAKRDDGSCNFCRELEPKVQVYLFNGELNGGLCCRICSDCLRELITKIRNL